MLKSVTMPSFIQCLRGWRLRRQGVRLAGTARIGPSVRASRGRGRNGPGTILCGPDLQLEDGVILDAWGGTIRLGTNVFIGPGAVIYGHGGVEIGDQTLVSMHCRILSSNHTVPPPGVAIRSQPDILLPTKIGRDVWLGAGVTVLGGVTIGDGCVVGAGAVVSHNLPAEAIALGVPARVVRQRNPVAPQGSG
jgi:acetyltransferase-like isoleucine patch superfamily enzyme